jgi:hypothetical protein
LKLLLELNPDVRGEWIDRDPSSYFGSDSGDGGVGSAIFDGIGAGCFAAGAAVASASAAGAAVAQGGAAFLATFSLVVCCSLPAAVAPRAHAALYSLRVPFVATRACGLAGTVVCSFAELLVVESSEKWAPADGADLRLTHPFPSLRAAVDAVDLKRCVG